MWLVSCEGGVASISVVIFSTLVSGGWLWRLWPDPNRRQSQFALAAVGIWRSSGDGWDLALEVIAGQLSLATVGYRYHVGSVVLVIWGRSYLSDDPMGGETKSMEEELPYDPMGGETKSMEEELVK